MEEYLTQFVALADGMKLSILVSLIAANLVLGLAVSIWTKTFRLKAVGDFLLSRILPYILGYFTVVIVAIVMPAFEVAVTIVWAFITATLIGAILAKLKEMGIKLPESLAGKKPEGS